MYRQRFGIETSYRQMNQVRARTTSQNPVICLLLVGLAFVIFNLYIACREHLAAVLKNPVKPISKYWLTLRRLAHMMSLAIQDLFGLADVILPMLIYHFRDLLIMQSLINAEKSDLFDVLEYIYNSDFEPITRELRVAKAQSKIFSALSVEQKGFVEFVLSKYIETGVEELDQEKLPHLLVLKYKAIEDAKEILGSVENIRAMFINFQGYLYEQHAAAA
ncbi:MAG: hypothetical protein HY869_07465 [Chloroflexi bacterium]|nr:hypothetical protein [Chloroflexota bacterium]